MASTTSNDTNLPSDDDLTREAYRCFSLSKEQTQDWRYESADLYDMVAGRHISLADRDKMNRDDKVIVEFNLMAKFLDSVQGLQINNRQEIRYIPRTLGNVGVNELLTGAADWVRDRCDALTEESEGFLDCIIAGIGAIETYVDLVASEQGEIGIGRRDPLEMYWDPHARQRNLLDARWVGRARRMAQQDFEERWPDAADRILANPGRGSPIFEGDEFIPMIHDDSLRPYEPTMTGYNTGYTPNSNNPINLIEYQWFKIDTMYDVTTQTGQKRLTPRVWARMKTVLEKNRVLYQVKNVKAKRWYRSFLANGSVVEMGESPYQNGPTYQFITGRRDRNQNTWYGVARALKDPQLWVDKFFSEIMSIINKNAKGGIIAEEDAFTDPARAEADWARADSIVFVENGAVAQGKITPKPQAPYPEGIDRLMQFTMGSFQGVTGINLEMLGMADRMQPGVVEAQRKESAIATLAWAFDSMRRYYIEHGKCLAYYIKEYISDNRLIRINGPEGQQFVPLVRDQLTFDYDVIVDEAPSSPNKRERNWAVLMNIVPLVLQAGLPIPKKVLDYLPLDSDLIEAWKQEIAQRQQQGPPPPSPTEQADIQLKSAQAKRYQDQTQLDAQANQIKAAQVAQSGQKVKLDSIGKMMDDAKDRADRVFKQVDAMHKLAQIPKLGAETEAIRKQSQGKQGT